MHVYNTIHIFFYRKKKTKKSLKYNDKNQNTSLVSHGHFQF